MAALHRLRLWLLVLALACAAGGALAMGGLMPWGIGTVSSGNAAIVFDSQIEDQGYNRLVMDGADRFQAEGLGTMKVLIAASPAAATAELRALATAGFDPIMVAGYTLGEPLKLVAAEFPKTRFIVVEQDVDLPNVQQIQFREHEAAFLVGALAGLATEFQRFGFVGGYDIPPIGRFRCGIQQGLHFVRPGTDLLAGYTGDWDDVAAGRRVARQQIEAGAGVIFTAAGRAGLGALAEAAKQGKLATGVDANQNHLFPGSILTSLVKRVDDAVFQALSRAAAGGFKPGRLVFGLRDNVIGWTLDRYNAPLFDARTARLVNLMRTEIIQGDILVHDFAADGRCPDPESTLSDAMADFETLPPEPADEDAITVRAGVYVTDLSDFDLANAEYRIQFSAWYLHNDPQFNPARDVLLQGAKSVSVFGEARQRVGDTIWDRVGYNAVIHHDWDARHYPFDRQVLRIVLVDAKQGRGDVQFDADAFASHLHPSLRLDNWSVRDFRIDVIEESFLTDYGNPDPRSAGFDTRDEVVVSIQLKRHGLQLFLTLYTGFLIATILGIFATVINSSVFLLNHTDLRTRLTLAVGGIFGAVGNSYVLHARLPHANSFTLTDSLELTTFGVLILSMLGSLLSEVFYKGEHYRTLRTTNLAIALLILFGHIGWNGYLVLRAAAS